jgi:myotubularin-related protein 5/13
MAAFIMISFISHNSYSKGGGQSVGKIIQRFPEKDWDDCPCTVGIELVIFPS